MYTYSPLLISYLARGSSIARSDHSSQIEKELDEAEMREEGLTKVPGEISAMGKASIKEILKQQRSNYHTIILNKN